jgi:hypothetical protein
MKDGVLTEVEALTEKLELPKKFYERLLREDDWSFVIKLNALVEAACCDALAARLHAPELATCFATLDLGHTKHGKVALLRSLKALTKEQSMVLQLLYELRNKLAHSVSTVDFTFSDHVQAMKKEQLNSFVKRLSYGVKPNPKFQSVEEFVTLNPKTSLWLSTAVVLACLHVENDLASVRLTDIALEQLAKARANTVGQ